MAQVVLGVFSDRDDAESALTDLEDEKFNVKDISIIMKDQAVARDIADDTGASPVSEGAVSGATTGGLIGGIAGLLVGIGAITVPGIGALFIAGPVAAALGLTGAAASTVSGAVTGALAGGLIGALTGLGVPEEDARVYEERVKAGGILLMVPTANRNVDEVEDILEDNGADQIKSVDLKR